MKKKWLKRVCALSMASLTALMSPLSVLAETTDTTAESAVVVEDTAKSSVSISAVSLPTQSWQAQAGFSSAGDSNEVTFTGYEGQGTIYVTVDSGIESFLLFVNNEPVDTASLTEGTWLLDISGLTVNGTNTVQVSAVTAADASALVTISVGYPTVVEGIPEDAEMDSEILNLISDLIRSEVDYGFSGAQLAIVKDGQMVYSNAWGAVNGYRSDGSRIEEDDEDYVAVTTDTLYDLASNTKMYSVNYAIQYLVDNEGFDIDAKVTDFFPTFDDEGTTILNDGLSDTAKASQSEWKSELTIRDILMHQAGFPADPQYHNNNYVQSGGSGTVSGTGDEILNNLYSQDRETTLEMILATPLYYEPGTSTVYSDVDYMLLCFIIEQYTGMGLDEWLEEYIYGPLGLENITYNPLDNGWTVDQIAATELNGNSRDGLLYFTNIREGVVQGTVHDEKAYYSMGGVSGHAGLFSNAEDLAILASVMLTGGYGDVSLFSQDTIDEFTKAKSTSNYNFGLGWWREGEASRYTYFTTNASSGTVGHQGWTGTLTVIDPEQDLVIVLLTNKKNSPVLDNAVSQNDFYSDNMVLGCLGIVVGLVYESFMSSVDAMDSEIYQMAMDRMYALRSHSGKYDEVAHMNDAFALADTMVDWAERRQNQETCDYAVKVLDQLETIVNGYVTGGYLSSSSSTSATTQINANNVENAQKWLTELRARVAAIEVSSENSQPEPAMVAVQVDSMPGATLNAAGTSVTFTSGSDQNAVYYPRSYSSGGSTAYTYNNQATWFEGYEGQGTIYFAVYNGGVSELSIFVNGVEVDTSAMVGVSSGYFAIDISDYTVNGRNVVHVSTGYLTARRMLFVVTNMTVEDGTASEDQGIDSAAFDLIDSMITSDIENGASGAQLAVIKDGQLVYSNAWGENADTDSVYEIGAATEVFATTYAIQKLATSSASVLTRAVGDYVTGYGDLGSLTVADLLKDESGLERAVEFEILGAFVEAYTGKSLGEYVQGNLYNVVGVDKITYADDLTGHTGLSANAEDLATLAYVMINHSGYGSSYIWSYNLIDYMTARTDSDATLAHGWMRNGDGGRAYYFGDQSDSTTIGYVDEEAGSLVIVDMAEDLVIVYLTGGTDSDEYTSADMGFVADIIYSAMEENNVSGDIASALDAEAADRAMSKISSLTGESDEAAVRAAYALADVVFDNAESRTNTENIAAAYRILGALDADRDGEVIKELTERLKALDPDFYASYAVLDDLEVTAELTGTEWTDEMSFTVTLAAADEATAQAIEAGTAVVPQTEATLTNTADTAVFDAMLFGAAGTYTFTAQQTNYNIANVRYDTAVRYITITVTESGTAAGTYEIASVSITSADGGGSSLTFTNIYDEAIDTVVISGTVTLTGRTMEAGEFSFILEAVSAETEEDAEAEEDAEEETAEGTEGEDAEGETAEGETPEGTEGEASEDAAGEDAEGESAGGAEGGNTEGETADDTEGEASDDAGGETAEGTESGNTEGAESDTGEDGNTDGAAVVTVEAVEKARTVATAGEPADGAGDESADGAGNESADGTGNESADGAGNDSAGGTGSESSESTGGQGAEGTEGESFEDAEGENPDGEIVEGEEGESTEITEGEDGEETGSTVNKSLMLTAEESTEEIEIPMPTENTVANSADGSFGFESIVFDTEGTYVYKLTQEIGTDPFISYDTTEYTVTVVVTMIAGVAVTELSYSVNGVDVDAVTFNNTYEFVQSYTDISGEIVWNDSGNQYEKRPEFVTITLIVGEEEVETITVTEADGWTWSFTDKEVYDISSGEVETITYTVTAGTLEYYTRNISGDMTDGFVVTYNCTYNESTGDESGGSEIDPDQDESGGDTGGDTGSGDTGSDTGSGDTGSDTGSGDTGSDTGSGDTGDTGSDTGSGDTSGSDTGSDTGSGDTSGTDTDSSSGSTDTGSTGSGTDSTSSGSTGSSTGSTGTDGTGTDSSVQTGDSSFVGLYLVVMLAAAAAASGIVLAKKRMRG